MYREKKVELHRAKFSVGKLKVFSVSLWNIAPVWPGRPKAKLTEQGLCDLVREAYARSSNNAHMILWMPASELHRSEFDPISMCDPWISQSTIFSGGNPLHIGFVYARSQSKVDWDTKLILDAKGRRGPSSPKTMRFALDKLGDIKGPVVDPFAHRSAVLPIWTRRKGIRYVGFTSSKKSYNSIVKALAQVELPGIQLTVLT